MFNKLEDRDEEVKRRGYDSVKTRTGYNCRCCQRHIQLEPKYSVQDHWLDICPACWELARTSEALRQTLFAVLTLQFDEEYYSETPPYTEQTFKRL